VWVEPASMSSFSPSSACTASVEEAFIGSRSLGTLPGMPELQRSRLQMIRCAACVRCLRRISRAGTLAWLELNILHRSREIKRQRYQLRIPCTGGRLTAVWLAGQELKLARVVRFRRGCRCGVQL
jgi:hypothetical protein